MHNIAERDSNVVITRYENKFATKIKVYFLLARNLLRIITAQMYF